MSAETLTAVVTGAASGIGRALAEVLHARGTRLVLADVNAEGLSETATRLGATSVVADVADPESMNELAARAPEARMICLNAGIIGKAVGAPWEVPPEDWDRVFSVNVGGVVNGLRSFVPGLLASGEPARVLITASLAGLAVFPAGGAYSPSKHAVTAVARHAAMALADTPIQVSMLCPGFVSTGMSPRGVDPTDLANEALQAMEDGVFAIVPERWREAVVGQVERVVSGQQPESPVPKD